MSTRSGFTASAFRDYEEGGNGTSAGTSPAAPQDLPSPAPKADAEVASLPPPSPGSSPNNDLPTPKTVFPPPKMPEIPVPKPGELTPPGKKPPFFRRSRIKRWEADASRYNDALARMAAAIEVKQDLLLDLCRERSIVVTPVSPKGGAGKTSSSTCLAAALGDATSYDVLVIDANPDWGGAAKRLGIPDTQTLSLSQLVGFMDLGSTAAEIRGLMKPTKNKVSILRSDDANVRRLHVDQFTTLVKKLQELYRIIILDTGTAITSDINMACVELSDVVLFPLLTTSGNATEGGPVDGCLHARQQLTANGFPDKVKQGITVALGVQYGQSLDPFREATANPDGTMLPVPYDAYVDQNQVVRVVPFDRYTANAEKGTPQASISPHTQLAWLDIGIAAFNRAKPDKKPPAPPTTPTEKEAA